MNRHGIASAWTVWVEDTNGTAKMGIVEMFVPATDDCPGAREAAMQNGRMSLIDLADKQYGLQIG
jgi:hypothetical protein